VVVALVVVFFGCAGEVAALAREAATGCAVSTAIAGAVAGAASVAAIFRSNAGEVAAAVVVTAARGRRRDAARLGRRLGPRWSAAAERENADMVGALVPFVVEELFLLFCRPVPGILPLRALYLRKAPRHAPRGFSLVGHPPAPRARPHHSPIPSPAR